MDRTVPIDEARKMLGRLIEELDDHEVYIYKHSKPVAVMISPLVWKNIIDALEDAEDLQTLNEHHDDDEYEAWEDVKATLHEN